MDKHRLGISTVSMGWHPNHTLEAKIAAASKHSFAGVEIFWTDLLAFAGRDMISPFEAASAVRDLCRDGSLETICLGSFDNFEGSRTPLSERLAMAKEWTDVAHALGTDLIQIPSDDAKMCNGEDAIIMSELSQLADLGNAASPPIRFAYEALGWGTHVADREESLRVVELVHRRNFGLCVDTYHILARLWADPTSSDSGTRPGGKAVSSASMKRLLNIPNERIFYVQLSDAGTMLNDVSHLYSQVARRSPSTSTPRIHDVAGDAYFLAKQARGLTYPWRRYTIQCCCTAVGMAGSAWKYSTEK